MRKPRASQLSALFEKALAPGIEAPQAWRKKVGACFTQSAEGAGTRGERERTQKISSCLQGENDGSCWKDESADLSVPEREVNFKKMASWGVGKKPGGDRVWEGSDDLLEEMVVPDGEVDSSDSHAVRNKDRGK